jgi:Family of unknown function (DUF6247)
VTADPLSLLTASAAPAAIRAGLLAEEIGDFDREYRQVMADATETLDLRPVLEMLERWRRVVVSSHDPQAHRRMLAAADRLRRGKELPTESWEQTRQRFGL